MTTHRPRAAALALVFLPWVAGCVSRPATVAHVHIGHATTGVHVTPNKEGYMVTAQRRAQEAIDFSIKALGAADLGEVKHKIVLADQGTSYPSSSAWIASPQDGRLRIWLGSCLGWVSEGGHAWSGCPRRQSGASTSCSES
jgi:hypothetical protein